MRMLTEPSSERQFIMYEALRKGADVQALHETTHIKHYFIEQMKQLVNQCGLKIFFTTPSRRFDHHSALRWNRISAGPFRKLAVKRLPKLLPRGHDKNVNVFKFLVI